MKTGRMALWAVLTALCLSGTQSAWAAEPKAPARGKAKAGEANPVQLIDGAMVPSETLGPARKPAKRDAADNTSGPSPQVRVPGMTRYRSVGREDAVLFDAPSDKAKKLYQAPRGMPVEVLSVLQAWVKVRDMQGDVAWVNRDDLADRRTVIATDVIPLYKEPSAEAGEWFQVAHGVVFDLQEERPVSERFVRVHHADGQTGFVDMNQVWGL